MCSVALMNFSLARALVGDSFHLSLRCRSALSPTEVSDTSKTLIGSRSDSFKEDAPSVAFRAGCHFPPMLTALILICSATVTPEIRDCTRDNAAAVMRVPIRFRSPGTCFMYGRAYLAEAKLGWKLGTDDRVKVICARTETVADSIPALAAE